MNGCSMPDTCVSEPIGLDGIKCSVPCPTSPPADHYVCPGGFDMNGCPIPDTYIPNVVGIITLFTTPPPTCPVTCPTPCGPGEMRCYGGMDANGCMMPDTCIPAFGK